MPVEIREIGIKMRTAGNGDTAAEGDRGSAGGELNQQARVGILKTCIQRVRQLLRTAARR